jgi:hypothetical protein
MTPREQLEELLKKAKDLSRELVGKPFNELPSHLKEFVLAIDRAVTEVEENKRR